MPRSVTWGTTCFLVVLVALATSPPATANRRTLELKDGHRGTTLRLRPFGRLGRPTRLAWARVDHFLASRRGGARRTHPRLVRLLVQTSRHFSEPLAVYSAYRSPRDPGGPHGYHGLGRAIDVRLARTTARRAFEYCRSFPRAGCGLYPNTAFVHIDSRPRSAVWIDLSTGDRHAYVQGVDAWLARHPDAGQGPATRAYAEPRGRDVDEDNDEQGSVP
jgi:uncharacterized protein YcbK (DUF882 family)